MGLCELLLQQLLRVAELGREALGHALQGGLGAALLHLHGEDGLVELRMASVIQGVLHVGIFQEGGDQRVDDRVVRVQDLDPHGVLLLLEESELHGRVRSGSVDLRLCRSLRHRTQPSRWSWTRNTFPNGSHTTPEEGEERFTRTPFRSRRSADFPKSSTWNSNGVSSPAGPYETLASLSVRQRVICPPCTSITVHTGLLFPTTRNPMRSR